MSNPNVNVREPREKCKGGYTIILVTVKLGKQGDRWRGEKGLGRTYLWCWGKGWPCPWPPCWANSGWTGWSWCHGSCRGYLKCDMRPLEGSWECCPACMYPVPGPRVRTKNVWQTLRYLWSCYALVDFRLLQIMHLCSIFLYDYKPLPKTD